MKTSKIKTVRNIGRIRTLLVTLSVAVCLATLMGCGNSPEEDVSTAADPIGAVRKQTEAATRTRQAAEQGDPVAAEVPETLPYAKDAEKVHVVSIGEDKGATLPYAKDAEAGDADAQYGLGGVYLRGYYVPKDVAEAAKWYRKAAEQGLAKAQDILGGMYFSGRGVPQDDAEAVKWYRKAAEQGYGRAQSNLGTVYEMGRGVAGDAVTAYAWYSVAAASGNDKVRLTRSFQKKRDSIKRKLTPSQLEKGKALATEISERIEKRKAAKADETSPVADASPTADVKALRKKAEAGNAKAQYNLGVMYRLGKGVPKDVAEAVKWYRKAAEQGHAAAQGRLGSMYVNGWGVPRDSAKAEKWCRKAAEQGYADAQYNLGQMYAYGFGVPQDDVVAYAWYSVAAPSGRSYNARKYRDRIKRKLTPSQLEKGKALATEISERIEKRKAAKADETSPVADASPTADVKAQRKKTEAGDVKAQRKKTEAGDVKAQRKKTEAGDVKAQRKKAEAGDVKAQWLLARRYHKGQGVRTNDAEAVKWYRKAAEQGYADAQFFLGAMYDTGRGVPEDDVAAYAWYSVAAASGYDSARKYRDMIKRKLTPTELEKGEVMAREISERIEKRKAAKGQ